MEKWGKEMLEKWKVEEAEYKLKVVDLREHAKLKNPYDLDGAIGVSLPMSVR